MNPDNARDNGFQASCAKALGIYENLRCICNRLVCKIDDDVIEIKCPRCKRLIRIYTGGIGMIEYL